MTHHVKPLILAGTLLALLIVIATSPVTEWLADGITWIRAHPGAAEVAFVVAYIVGAVLVFPSSILTLAAGFVFGLWVGIALVSAGGALGAAAAFLVGRFFARDWVSKRVARLPKFHALESATRHEGFVIVLLTRLSPFFPFNLLNYGFGLTAVRFRDYFFATWIGMLPVTFAYVYVGTLAKDLTQLTSGLARMPGHIWLLLAGFALTVVLTLFITRRANRMLAAHLDAESRDGG